MAKQVPKVSRFAPKGTLVSETRTLPKLLLPDTALEVDPQVAALAHLLADPSVDEGIKAQVRAEVTVVVSRAWERAVREAEGDRA